MVHMVKFNSLTIPQLDHLLRLQNTVVKGNKAAKVAKLCELYASDEVEDDLLVEEEEDNTVAQQIEALQNIVAGLTTAVQDITARLCTNQPNPSARQVQQDTSAETPATQSQVTQERPRSTASQRNWTSKGIQELANLLPDFDPINGAVTSAQFLEKVAQLRRTYEWTEEEVLLAVQGKMQGVAKDWVAAQPVFPSWFVFETRFVTDFPSTSNSAEIHRELSKRKRKPNESLKEYFYAMLNIGRRGDVDEEAINSYIITGLNDPQLTRMLLAMKFDTCVDLMKSLENVGMQARPVYEAMQNRSQQPDRIDRNDSRGDNRCYNCGGVGHIAIRCTKPLRKPRCTRCNKIGHEAKDCGKHNRSTVAAIKNANSTTVPPVTKMVKIQGKSMEAFVDTGSDVSLISRSAAAEWDTKPAVRCLKGFGGATTWTTECVEAAATIDEQNIVLKLLLVDDNLLPGMLLVGRDVLQELAQRDVLNINARQDHEFKIYEGVAKGAATQITNLLSKYGDCFSEGLDGIGRCKVGELEIEVTTTSPIVGKRYLIPFSQRNIEAELLKDMKQHNIIRPSCSPHAASALLVKKSSGEYRLCVDYRTLNAVTVKKHYMMPVVEEQLSRLKGNQWFTTLDMTAGYYQIPIKESSKKYTAFLTHEGLFEFNVMPFGLVNAPMVFQEIVASIIRTLPHKDGIINYVDEVIIATNTIEENLNILEEFLTALRQVGLTLRPSKCYFMQKQVNFLGHKIDGEGIHPGEEKVKCIKEFPAPKTVTEVRRFLGVTGFFRKFVNGYSIVAKPLTELLKKNTEFQWGEAQATAFNVLKEKLSDDPILTIYNPSYNHEIHTDASSVGLSGVLLQEENGNLKAVFYFSRRCNEAESKYSSHELETLAVVEAAQRFRLYVLGKRFRIVTDCDALASTKDTTPLLPRIARWWLKLQEFDFECVHRAGAKLCHADALSRAPVLNAADVETVAEKVLHVTNETDWVGALQRQDDEIKSIIAVLNGADHVNKKQLKEDFVQKQGRLYRKTPEGCKLVVPRKLRWRIVKACHDDYGHFGAEKTAERVLKEFWFPKMTKYVKEFVNSCPECCINKQNSGKAEGQLHVSETLPIPFRTIHLDHAGPFPRSKRGNLYVLVIVCAFSKHTVVKPLRNTKTGPVIEVLSNYFATYGQPLQIITDRGTAFTSKAMEEFTDKHGIKHVKVAVRTPRANGQAERQNRTILPAIRCMTEKENEWDEKLPMIQWGINSQVNKTTGCSPNDLIFNFNPRDFATNRLIQALDDDIVSDHIKPVNQMAIAAENINKAKQEWKRKFDAKRKPPTHYKEGDLVALQHVTTATGKSHKLEPKFKGPYAITKALGHDRYIVEDLPDVPQSQRRYAAVHVSDNLKPWYCLASADEDSPQSDEGSGVAEL